MTDGDEAGEVFRLSLAEFASGRLRIGLDINKDSLKVLVTSSSREGLRRMFSEARAPLFHFGTNIKLPILPRSRLLPPSRRGLPVLDRQVLLAVLDAAPLFAEDTRRRIGIQLGTVPPSTTAVQSPTAV